MTYSPALNRAYDTLSHYLRNAYEAGGLPWSGDNELEVRSIVEDIVLAVSETASPPAHPTDDR